MKKYFLPILFFVLLTACGSSSRTTKSSKNKEQNLAKLKFGIEIVSLSEEIKKESGLSHGVVITNVYSFFPANKAGIVKGDIILNIDKHTIISLEEFKTLLQQYKYTYGQVSLRISRNNKIQKIKVYLE